MVSNETMINMRYDDLFDSFSLINPWTPMAVPIKQIIKRI